MGKYLFAAAMALTVPAQAQVVGISSAVQNDVRLKKPGALPRPVALRQRISIAEMIQTGAKSQLQMLLLDKSMFTVGPNARLTIDRYVYDPARNARSMGATVTRGAFRFLSGRRTQGGTSTINTPVGTIGVRGTMLDGVVGENAALIAAGEAMTRRVRGDPETATLIVLRGPGRATQGDVSPGVIDITASGRTVTVDRPMQAVYVPYPGGPVIGPFPLSNSGLMQLQAVLFPALAQRLGLQPPVDPDQTFAPRSDIWPPPGTVQEDGRGPGRGPNPLGRPGDLNGDAGPPRGFAPGVPALPDLPGIQPGRPAQRPQTRGPAVQGNAGADSAQPAPIGAASPPAKDSPPSSDFEASPPPVRDDPAKQAQPDGNGQQQTGSQPKTGKNPSRPAPR